MKARELRRILERAPLNYQVKRSRGGSHTVLTASGRPTLTWSFHDGQTLAPGLVRKILKRDIGLTDEEVIRQLPKRRHEGSWKVQDGGQVITLKVNEKDDGVPDQIKTMIEAHGHSVEIVNREHETTS